MNRNDFIRRIVQAGLFALLAFLLFSLKNRIVAGPECSSCPENGRCAGRQYCDKN